MGVFDCRRGQTEGIAVILLTGILIVGIGTFGAFYLSSLSQPSGAAAPAVSADVDVSVVNESGTATLTVTHTGGESIEEGAVIMRSRGDRYALPRPFEAGMRNSTTLSDASPGDVLRVIVVENASQSVVFQSRVTVQGDSGAGVTTPAPTSTATPTPTPTATPTPTPTDTPTPTTTDTPTPNSDPSVTITSVTEETKGNSGNINNVEVIFEPDDPDENLDNATVVVYFDGAEQGRTTTDLTGDEGSSISVTIDGQNQNPDEIRVVVTVYDGAGASGSDDRTQSS